MKKHEEEENKTKKTMKQMHITFKMITFSVIRKYENKRKNEKC